MNGEPTALPVDSPPDAAVADLRRGLVGALLLLWAALSLHNSVIDLPAKGAFLACLAILIRQMRSDVASASAGRGPDDPLPWRAIFIGLALILALRPAGAALLPGTSWVPQGALALLLGGLGIYGAAHPQRNTDRLAWLAMAATGAVFVYLLRHSPSPRIDVFILQQQGAAALWAGRNPYSLLYPNPYDPVETTHFFGHYIAALDHYPYPPLSLLLTAVSHRLVGDVRALFLLLHLGAGAVLYRLGRRQGCGLVLLCLHLLHPQGFLIIEQAWTEPLLCATFAAWLLWRSGGDSGRASTAELSRLGVRGQALCDGLLFGLVLSSKQYALLILPLYLWARGWPTSLRPHRALATVAAIAVSALPALVFLWWGPADFIEDVLLFQARQPFRPDAMSLPAMFWDLTDRQLPGVTSLVGWLLPLALLWRRGEAPRLALPAGVAGLSLLSMWMMMGFFATAKQAFANYYYFVGFQILLCGALADRRVGIGLPATRADR